MSVYVYRNAGSDSARELAMALGGRKIRHTDGRGFYFKRQNGDRTPVQFTNQDVVVCWGQALDPTQIRGARVLNGQPIQNKYDDAVQLRAAGVPTVEVSLTRPRAVAPAPPPPDPAVALWNAAQEEIREFVDTPFGRNPVLVQGLTGLVQQLQGLRMTLLVPAPVAGPAQPVGEWLPRLRNHVGGNDLLAPPARPEFWVKKLDLVREFRVHSFLGRSIRAGVKGPREGFPNPHAWIRSFDAGWAIRYDGVTTQQAHRDLARRACEALGLQFGAVDIGETPDGRVIVLEVNRAPGLADGTITRYAGAILRWVNNENQD